MFGRLCLYLAISLWCCGKRPVASAFAWLSNVACMHFIMGHMSLHSMYMLLELYAWLPYDAMLTQFVFVLAACAAFEQTHKRQAVAADFSAVKQIVDKHIAQAQACKVQVPDAFIEEFLCAEPLPAVNAICGGILANELLKAVSHKGEPVNNFFFLSLSDSAGIVQRVG